MPRMSTHGQPLKRQRSMAMTPSSTPRRPLKARNRRVSVPRNKLGFPQSMRATLRYTDPLAFNLNSLDQAFFVTMLANGMYDPQVALGGHQPRGFDDFMGLYQKFTVLGSSISVNFVYEGYDGPAEMDNDTDSFLIKTNKAETNGAKAAACAPVTVGIHKGVATPGAGTVSETCEKDKSVWKAMTPQQGGVTVKTSMKSSDFFGKRTLVGAEGYCGDNASDPEEKIYYSIWAGRMSGNNAGTCRIRAYLTIQYDAVFTEPKILRAS